MSVIWEGIPTKWRNSSSHKDHGICNLLQVWTTPSTDQLLGKEIKDYADLLQLTSEEIDLRTSEAESVIKFVRSLCGDSVQVFVHGSFAARLNLASWQVFSLIHCNSFSPVELVVFTSVGSEEVQFDRLYDALKKRDGIVTAKRSSSSLVCWYIYKN